MSSETTKTGNARVIDIDTATAKVLASYKVARAELSFGLAKAEAYIFGDDDGLAAELDGERHLIILKKQ